MCRHCADNLKSINEMHGHALGIHKDNMPIYQENKYHQFEICQIYFRESKCQMEHIEAMQRYCDQWSKDFFNDAGFRIHKENIQSCKTCRKYLKEEIFEYP